MLNFVANPSRDLQVEPASNLLVVNHDESDTTDFAITRSREVPYRGIWRRDKVSCYYSTWHSAVNLNVSLTEARRLDFSF